RSSSSCLQSAVAASPHPVSTRLSGECATNALPVFSELSEAIAEPQLKWQSSSFGRVLPVPQALARHTSPVLILKEACRRAAAHLCSAPVPEPYSWQALHARIHSQSPLLLGR